MRVIVRPDGSARAIYGEAIDLAALGRLSITRASTVEPNGDGRWVADLTPVGGPQLGPFAKRSDALRAELRWLDQNWLSHA
jgi:hypothetical protein